VDVTFTVAKPDDRKDLAKVVTVTDLGEISGSDATTIVNAINDKNTDLNLTEADVDVAPNGDDTGATVTAKDWIRKLYWYSGRYIYSGKTRW
jgi:hypothetical protein